MLTYEQRIERYRAQTGRQTLTPRQRRRFEHKLGHQLDEAVELRAKRSAARQETHQKRAQERTSAVLPKTSR